MSMKYPELELHQMQLRVIITTTFLLGVALLFIWGYNQGTTDRTYLTSIPILHVQVVICIIITFTEFWVPFSEWNFIFQNTYSLFISWPSQLRLQNTSTASLHRGRLPQRVFWIWHETNWRWGSSNAGTLKNAEYPFIAIAPRSTLTWSGSTW